MKNNESLEEKLHGEISKNDVVLLDGDFNCTKNDVISFEDAAALCQYVYASNPLYEYGHVKYKSKSRGWYPYIIDDTRQSFWNKIRNGVSGMLGNGAYLGFSTNDNDELSRILKEQENSGKVKNYSSIELYGLLGGRIEAPLDNPDELLAIIKGRLKRTRTGFRSMIFYKKNGKRIDSIVYVTEGSKSGLDIFGGGIRGTTDWFGDWILSNASQGITSLSPQHTLSIQNAKILDIICSTKNIKLCFVGHSLGGGLAVSNAIATNRPAVVFDMAGLHKIRRSVYKDVDTMEKGGKLVNFYIDGEFLSTKGYEAIGPNHIEQSVPLKYIGNKKYDAFTLHNFIFFCKYFHLELLESEDNVFVNGI